MTEVFASRAECKRNRTNVATETQLQLKLKLELELPVCRSVCLSAYLSACLSVRLHVCLSACLPCLSVEISELTENFNRLLTGRKVLRLERRRRQNKKMKKGEEKQCEAEKKLERRPSCGTWKGVKRGQQRGEIGNRNRHR